MSTIYCFTFVIKMFCSTKTKALQKSKTQSPWTRCQPLCPAADPAELSWSQVKLQVEEKEGKKFEVFNAVEFKTQLVAGINYFIKVHVGNEEFLHLRVFKSLPHENKPLSLASYQSSKTTHDELAYF
ncbi:cystatin-B-like [Pelodiscus sinensis]|uniref:cystatin-B-like n=1 Tax=Pelodiscus sinensis TaxID=13735 RepID=UPI003F6CC2FC